MRLARNCRRARLARGDALHSPSEDGRPFGRPTSRGYSRALYFFTSGQAESASGA